LRRAALVAAAALALVPAGCGGDDEKANTTGGGQQTAARSDTETTTATTPTTTQTTETESHGNEDKGKTGPEDQQGGAGDEVPARSLALLTGRNGKITPTLVRVPPFISVRIELRSADGRRYELRIAGKRLVAGGDLSSSRTTIDGLRAGAAYNGRAGDGGRVRIEASAEPGP
jgi:hypothetical protein